MSFIPVGMEKAVTSGNLFPALSDQMRSARQDSAVAGEGDAVELSGRRLLGDEEAESVLASVRYSGHAGRGVVRSLGPGVLPCHESAGARRLEPLCNRNAQRLRRTPDSAARCGRDFGRACRNAFR